MLQPKLAILYLNLFLIGMIGLMWGIKATAQNPIPNNIPATNLTLIDDSGNPNRSITLRPIPEKIIELSSHEVKIGLNFRGNTILLFGSLDKPTEDIIVTVRGPAAKAELWQKYRLFGIWVNGRKREFIDIPSYYFWAVTRPDLLKQVSNFSQYQFELGGDAILQNFYDKLVNYSNREDKVAKDYAKGLLESFEQYNLYFLQPRQIKKLGTNIFRVNIPFTPETPLGSYQVDVYRINRGQITAIETTIVKVEKIGFSDSISYFAQKHALLYGIIAIILAVILGSLSSLSYTTKVKEKISKKINNQKPFK